MNKGKKDQKSMGLDSTFEPINKVNDNQKNIKILTTMFILKFISMLQPLEFLFTVPKAMGKNELL